MASYDNLNLSLCETLYSQGAGAHATPYYTYNHSSSVVVRRRMRRPGGSSISGLAFYNGGTFPSAYNGALFFADYSRRCIWVMFEGANGLPDPATRQVFVTGGPGPVDLQVGPGRRPLLRGPGRRHDPPRARHRRQSGARPRARPRHPPPAPRR